MTILAFYLLLPVSTLAKADFFTPKSSTKIVIKAINPGYSFGGKSNVGEFIELAKLSDAPVSLADHILYYTSSSGKKIKIFEFAEDSQMVGETLLLRLASSPDSSNSDATYTKTLALEAGPLELTHKEEIIDMVCWRGSGCQPKFKSDDPTSLVRDLTTFEFSHRSDYTPDFDSTHPGLFIPSVVESVVEPKCLGVQFSEVLSYYETTPSEQFIELYNSSDEDISLDGCQLQYKNKSHPLSGVIKSHDFLAINAPSFVLSKNPTSSNTITLVDVNGDSVDELQFPHGQRKSASYAQFGIDSSGREQWLITFIPTPSAQNLFQEFPVCPKGKTLSLNSGHCVKPSTVKSLLQPCPAGKIRNSLSGRCKSIKSTTKEPKACKAGYELNPDTNRCRKIRQNTGADYQLAPQSIPNKSVTTPIIIIIIICTIGIIYTIFQFRFEIIRFLRYLKSKIPRP